MAKIHIDIIPALNDNYFYFLTCAETKKTAIIDPGSAEPVIQFLQNKDLPLDYIVLTHHHNDHTGGVLELKERYQSETVGAFNDRKRILGLDQYLHEGQIFSLGNADAKIIGSDGHTLGHISYYFAESDALFCGDSLFSVGCGRLFEGSAHDMYHSMCKFMLLPETTQVYCGHEYTLSNIKFALSVDGENQALIEHNNKVQSLRDQNKPSLPTTLALEKQINPFLRCYDSDIRKNIGALDKTNVEVFQILRDKKDFF